jgi:hypothetical protein
MTGVVSSCLQGLVQGKVVREDAVEVNVPAPVQQHHVLQEKVLVENSARTTLLLFKRTGPPA